MRFVGQFIYIVKDYCLNTTLAGLSYIVDSRFHFTERFFWLLCLLASTYGSCYLVRQSLRDFDEGSISMVVESLPVDDVTHFPPIGVCEIGHMKQVYSDLEKAVNSLRKTEEEEYNYDVEDFLLRVIFLNLYNYGSFMSYCSPYRDCDDCMKCPETNYSSFSEMVRRPCSELITDCVWNRKPFDCCKYFQPIQTTMGRCFLLNSIQNNEKFGRRWLSMWIDEKSNLDGLVSVSILNEEDIPHMLLTTLQFNQQHESTVQEILLNVQTIVNDDGVRDIDSEYRKCIFPDEESNSKYKYYSYSTCVTECLKRAQLRTCNCTHFHMVYDDNDDSAKCGYDGMTCLDRFDLVFPQTTIMQPWRSNGLVCDCLPSCNEHEIKLVGRTYITDHNDIEKRRISHIHLQSRPTQKYRRQAVRNNLDIVVSIGGIMGLFLGASILSAVEFLYFFTVRAFGNAYNKKNRF